MTLVMAAARATGYVQFYATDAISMTAIVRHLTFGFIRWYVVAMKLALAFR